MEKIFCDIRKCLGCKSCEIACAVEHSASKNIFQAIMEEKKPRQRVVVRSTSKEPFPLRCRHCEDAPCVQACMSGAMYKDEQGVTRHDPDKCVGCWMCIMVCPFGAISRQENLALKCDLCPDREDSFACVEACPTNALFVGTWEEFKKKLEQEKR